jgi:peptidoglycan/xylan/chitin deacetylase (PgdA/CDA1 family)
MSIRDMLKRKVAPFVVARVPASVCWRAAGSPLVLPYYHILTHEDAPHVKHLYRFRTVAEFRRDLDYLLAHYTPVTLEAILDALNEKRPLPDRPFHLTFDDGFREMHDVAMPILLAKGVPATFFITSGFVDNKDMAHHNQISLVIDHVQRGGLTSGAAAIEQLLRNNNIAGADWRRRLLAIGYRNRHLVKEAAALVGCEFESFLKSCKPYLSAAQVRVLLAKGFCVGAHSVDHPKYDLVSLEEQIRQTRESVKFIRDTFGISCPAFAFPHSDEGVGPEFFKEVFDGADLRISFGTGGMAQHFFPRHRERFTMEKTEWPADRILAGQYAKKLYNTVCGRGTRRSLTLELNRDMVLGPR